MQPSITHQDCARFVCDKPQKLVIMMHGIGSDANDLIALAPIMSLPHHYFISLNGIEEYDMAPYGRQWFSLQDRGYEAILRGLENANQKVNAIIKQHQKELGIENKDTILLGFSQGTIMSLYMSLVAQEQPYYAVVGFSGRLVPPQKVHTTSTPVCLIHGEDDEVLSIDDLFAAKRYLEKMNVSVASHALPNLTHSIDHVGIEIACDFLSKLHPGA
ncbi:putative hydrolase [Rickettsiales endosymbiont of Paramecium tredecaurelia]|uniref:alpha/beta hydrolase n=1 Tax=Candidatus Sarmatiella mevalonica TaxID=2770581 RepID=UPI001920B38A|nr:hydrolase [Candidatus Sarmatiella mevalonica]MBL3285235.1 putative hydrolase [Candidatus Sarmatiella mevalonica]